MIVHISARLGVDSRNFQMEVESGGTNTFKEKWLCIGTHTHSQVSYLCKDKGAQARGAPLNLLLSAVLSVSVTRPGKK